VSFIDSAIINVFITAYRNAEETGLYFRVADRQTRVRDMLDLTGVLYMLMPTS
jgi:anti-anti-sigma factor